MRQADQGGALDGLARTQHRRVVLPPRRRVEPAVSRLPCRACRVVPAVSCLPCRACRVAPAVSRLPYRACSQGTSRENETARFP